MPYFKFTTTEHDDNNKPIVRLVEAINQKLAEDHVSPPPAVEKLETSAAIELAGTGVKLEKAAGEAKARKPRAPKPAA